MNIGRRDWHNVTKYQSGDIVGYRFDDGTPPGLMRARILSPTANRTNLPVTSQLYQIEVADVVQASAVGIRPPRLGTKRVVSEKHLVSLAC